MIEHKLQTSKGWDWPHPWRSLDSEPRSQTAWTSLLVKGPWTGQRHWILASSKAGALSVSSEPQENVHSRELEDLEVRSYRNHLRLVQSSNTRSGPYRMPSQLMRSAIARCCKRRAGLLDHSEVPQGDSQVVNADHQAEEPRQLEALHECATGIAYDHNRLGEVRLAEFTLSGMLDMDLDSRQVSAASRPKKTKPVIDFIKKEIIRLGKLSRTQLDWFFEP